MIRRLAALTMNSVRNLITHARGFLSAPSRIIIVSIAVVTGLWALFATKSPVSTDLQPIVFFSLPGCHDCMEQESILEVLKGKGRISGYSIHDTSRPEGAHAFRSMAVAEGIDPSTLGLPALFVRGKLLVGLQEAPTILQSLEGMAGIEPAEGLADDFSLNLPLLGRFDARTLSLPLLTVVLGLVDGFNPCAMWVLVFMIGILTGMGDRGRIWLLVGSFLFASGLLYFLFLTAWLNAFLLTGAIRPLTVGIGTFALGTGLLGLRDLAASRGQVTCKVGSATGKKRLRDRIASTLKRPLTPALILAMIGLAFAVNSIEFVCSAAIPAVYAKVLALSSIGPLARYACLFLYTLFFMLDDIVVFSMAAFASGYLATSRFAGFSRLASSTLMVILGTMILFFPEVLK